MCVCVCVCSKLVCVCVGVCGWHVLLQQSFESNSMQYAVYRVYCLVKEIVDSNVSVFKCLQGCIYLGGRGGNSPQSLNALRIWQIH